MPISLPWNAKTPRTSRLGRRSKVVEGLKYGVVLLVLLSAVYSYHRRRPNSDDDDKLQPQMAAHPHVNMVTPDGASASKSFVWSKDAIELAAPPNRGLRSHPSASKFA